MLLCAGLLLGIAVAEAFYYTFDPMVLMDGAVEVVTDREYYAKVAPLLSGAKESIHMAMFSMNHQTAPEYKSSHVNKLIQSLIAARNKGLDVSLVMDDWPEGNEKSMEHLRKNNVPVVVVSLDGSLHDKLIIIDGRIVIVGSTNWSYHSVDKNNEANVIIDDARVAREFEAYLTSLAPFPAS